MSLLEFTTVEIIQTNHSFSNEPHQEIFDDIPLPIWVCDAETLRFLDVNSAARLHYGYSREEFLAMTIEEIGAAEDVPDFAPAPATPANLEACPAIVRKHRKKDGSEIDVEMTSKPFSFGGRASQLIIIRDVTEQRRFEEQLQKSEQLYRELFENANDIMYTVDFQGNFTSINRASERITGFTREETLKQNISEILTPESLEFSRKQMKNKIAGIDEGTVYEVEMIGKDGRRIPVDTSTRVIKQNGVPVAIQGISRDVTERKLAEQALRESEALRRSVMTGAPIVLFAVNKKGDFTMCEGRGMETLGLTAEMLVGHSVYQLYSEEKQALENIRRAMEGETFAANIKFGEVVFDVWYAPHSDLKGETIGVIGVATDVTERKRIEEKLFEREKQFESILSSLQEVVWSYSPLEEKLIYVSPAAENVCGLNVSEFYKNSNLWAEIVHPEDEEIFAAYLKELDLNNSAEVEYRILRPDGETRWLHKRANRIFEHAGPHEKRHVRTDGITADVTERKHLEQQLRHSQKLESVGQLAAGIAHEINTPIQYVRDNTRFLKDSFDDLTTALEKYAELFEACGNAAVTAELLGEVNKKIRDCDLEYLFEEIPNAFGQSLEGIERVTKIVQSMKDFAHPGSTDMKAVDLNRSIESTVTVTSNEWRYIADLELDLDKNIPPVPCFISEINQVVLNMIINAVHAIGDVVGDGSGGKGKITISTRADDEWAEIRITDSGTGIPEQAREHIFNPFFTTKEVGKGTGQGLAISHGVIVNKHSGKLTFETELDKGTTFIISLPLRPSGKNESNNQSA